ncbi:hypothetical protein DPMN_027120 [Dreissena polymorpha]|uniref:Uncharacterized protein n=1 Tax=Dreissena polymorpha TaxID=45954 RepID=A0A9D4RD65_DREPO|nr:hypothetical protein DPMN_027120 [Dreissena polymorpha]
MTFGQHTSVVSHGNPVSRVYSTAMIGEGNRLVDLTTRGQQSDVYGQLDTQTNSNDLEFRHDSRKKCNNRPTKNATTGHVVNYIIIIDMKDLLVKLIN